MMVTVNNRRVFYMIKFIHLILLILFLLLFFTNKKDRHNPNLFEFKVEWFLEFLHSFSCYSFYSFVRPFLCIHFTPLFVHFYAFILFLCSSIYAFILFLCSSIYAFILFLNLFVHFMHSFYSFIRLFLCIHFTGNSHNYGHPRDKNLMSGLADVRNSWSSLQSFPCSIAIELGICILPVIAGCP